MRSISIIMLFLAIQLAVLSQPCVPDTIVFYNQSLIDNFQTYHPNCNEIEGAVFIEGDDITNLNGLSVLIRIGGELEVKDNPLLTDFSGLENLNSIGGNFTLDDNDALSSMSGLDNLISIDGSFIIDGNDVLTGLTDLANLDSIGGDLKISFNQALVSLAGLENINASSISDLSIHHNAILDECGVQSICDYLTSPNGVVDINSNASGCNNPPEVADVCGITLPCLPYGNYYFNDQEDVDNFTSNYPGCTEINGPLTISGSDIMNLDGLSDITLIAGNLTVMSSHSLTSLEELDNVSFLGGALNLWFNDNLTSLAGLENITSIGGHVWISDNVMLGSLGALQNVSSIGGDFYITGNNAYSSLAGLDNVTSIGGVLSIQSSPNLTSLLALGNLTSIDGGLFIHDNTVLTSLAGLDAIDAATINEITIRNNAMLSTCEVLSVCNYLSTPNADIEIHDNATGCNSQAELEEACIGVGIEEVNVTIDCSISPNPCANAARLRYQIHDPPTSIGRQRLADGDALGTGSRYLICELFTIEGVRVRELLNEMQLPGEYEVEIDLSDLAGGMYFIRLKYGDQSIVRKLLKNTQQ